MSVVIPTWNRAASLPGAIASALTQTIAPSEVLVCDDGSTDESEQVIAALGEPDVRWLSGPHTGRPAVPRNRGVREARGEWIAFLDSDDAWLPEKLEMQLAAISRTGCRAACTNAWVVAQRAKRQPYLRRALPPILLFDHLVAGNYVICSSVLLHRSLLDAAEGFPEDAALTAIEDYALWLRVAALTGLAYLEVPLIEYRDEPAQSIRKPGGSVFTQRRRVLRNFLRWAQSVPGLQPHVHKAKAGLRRMPLDQVIWWARQAVSRARATVP